MWNHKIITNIDEEITSIQFLVKDKDTFSDDLIGICSVPVLKFISSEEGFEDSLQLYDKRKFEAGLRKDCEFIAVKPPEGEHADVSFEMLQNVVLAPGSCASWA